MLQIVVNGLTQRAGSTPENWGELLSSLESGDGKDRQVVTAVRFEGVAQPTFREPRALQRTLRGLAAIEVDTCTVDELLLRSARAAGESIVPLKRATARIAAALSAGSLAAGTRDLPALVRSVQTLTTITAGLAGATNCQEPHRADLEALVARLCLIVDVVVTGQAGARWARVAGVLDRELTPTLEAWVLVTRRVWNIS